MKKFGIAAILLLLLGPTIGLMSIGLLMNPALTAACTTGTSITVGNIPDALTVTTRDGTTFTLNKTQLTHAATIIQRSEERRVGKEWRTGRRSARSESR